MQFVSVLVVAVVMSVRTGSAGESPTSDSIVGKNIMSELAQILPHRDCSTPENAFLGFLRSMAEFNIRDYLFYLTPQAKKSIAGVEHEKTISDDKARDFEVAIKKAGFREFILESFQTIPDMSPTQIVAVVTSSRGGMIGSEKYCIGLVHTNGLWKFTYVNISVVEGNESYE